MTGRHAPVIEAYWYSIDWDVEAIWALDLPSETFLLAELVWHLDAPVWPGAAGPYTVTPRQVLADPAAHAEEHLRILRADLAFPIDIIRHKGRWLILDGIHRLAKATRAGATTIMARRVPRTAVRYP